MSDELTPQEKAAFESLPRERMPAGLEAKVVGAMREHGFLTKQRRVIELSRGRVAGVLAASVALVIVGYSLGLHEGRGREMIVPTETTPTSEPAAPKYAEHGIPPATEAPQQAPKADAPTDDDAAASRELKKEKVPTAPEVSALQANEMAEPAAELQTRYDQLTDAAPRQSRDAEVDLRARRVDNTASPAPATAREEQSIKALSRVPSAGSDSGARSKSALRPESFSVAESRKAITFSWDGQTFELEADSVRVFEDQWGRTLHIYTSEGVIRIRLAE